MNYCMCVLLLYKKTKKPWCPGSYSEANNAQLWSLPQFLFSLPYLPFSSLQAQAYSSIFPSGMPPSQSLICFSLYQHREPVSNTVPRKRNYKRKLAGQANNSFFHLYKYWARKPTGLAGKGICHQVWSIPRTHRVEKLILTSRPFITTHVMAHVRPRAHAHTMK